MEVGGEAEDLAYDCKLEINSSHWHIHNLKKFLTKKHWPKSVNIPIYCCKHSSEHTDILL
jgi:hypothetical protein